MHVTTPSSSADNDDEQQQRALEAALRGRAEATSLELAQQPGAWLRAALEDGVGRRPAGR